MRFWKFWKRKTVETEPTTSENSFMLVCKRCGWDFTQEYYQRHPKEMEINPRPWYGDHCSCGGIVVRVEVTA